jgi:glycosyltransferase involved in cell wall biosynthesis
VAIEAMAAGRPLIASRIGGLCDFVVDGETGFLVPPGDSTALRLAIEELLAHPQLREQMGWAARKKSKEFQASVVLPRIEQAYEALLKRHRR